MTMPVGTALNRELSEGQERGEKVEGELDKLIAQRHAKRVDEEGERAAEEIWAKIEREEKAKRREEHRVGWAEHHRRLQHVFAARSAEHGRLADRYERFAS